MRGTVKLSLDKVSPCEASAEMDTMRVAVRTGSTDILVSGEFSSNYNNAVAKAIELSNRFLNALSWQHNIFLEVQTDSYSIEGDGGLVIGLPALKIMTRMGIPTIALGDVIIDPACIGDVATNESKAATYYRHAHFSNHSFIKFENLYKTIENIADHIKLKYGYNNKSLTKKYDRNSFEKSLLWLALEECFRTNNRQLEQLVKSVSSIHITDESRMFEELAEQIYEGYRNRITHSKTAKKPYDPNKESDKQKIQEILPLLEFIALSLLKYEEATFH